MPPTSTLVAGRYRVGTQLGSGGMGVVWEAYDELLHRAVAVKELRYPPGIDNEERDKLARRTLREARAVAAVENPHAVRVFDIVEQDSRPWIVMEIVRGRTLTDVIRDRGALPVTEVVRIGLALTDALEAAHAAGVLHRDVKPSNVILGDDGRVALTDFGIATVDSDPTELTTSGQLVGSPAYMAPERARGEQPTAASDLWSLGATLWTAAEGRPPYDEGNAFATMTKVVSEDAPSCDRCDRDLAGLIEDLMNRDPAARPCLTAVRARLAAAHATDRPPPTPYPAESLPPAFDRTVALERPFTEEYPVAAPAVVTPAATPQPPPVTTNPRGHRLLPALLALAATVVAAAVLAAVIMGTGGGSSSRGSTARSAPDSSHSSVSLPSGWSRYTDPGVGWSIGVPAGWQVQAQGAGAFIRDPAGGRYLQVETREPAGPSATGAWEEQERAFRATHTGYQRIRLEKVPWRGYPDVADWEFSYTSGAVTLHAVDRGAVIGHRGYGLFFQTHSDQWNSSQQLLQQFYASFRPA